MLYATLALCAVFLGWLVVRYDLHQREPLGLMALALALGALGMHLAGCAQLWVIAWMHGRGQIVSNGELAAMAGASEELAKFGVVVVIALGARRRFNEPIDGLVYGAFAGLGAAIEESVAVLTMDGTTGFLPAAEPVRLAGHLIMGGIGGFGVGFIVLRSRLVPVWITLSLLGAMLLHTLWDVVAFAAFDAHRASGAMKPAHSAAAIALMLGGMAVFRALVGVGVRATGVMLARAPCPDARPEE
jgi:RsiW-degrading membrane proteinase PrsW (M82 family)